MDLFLRSKKIPEGKDDSYMIEHHTRRQTPGTRTGKGRSRKKKENRISRKWLAVPVGIVLAAVLWFTGMQFFARPEHVDVRNGQGQESSMLFQENSKAGGGDTPSSPASAN